MPTALPLYDVKSLVRTLSLSAAEIRSMTEWPDAMIQDYLSLVRNLLILAEAVDEKQNLLRTIINISIAESPFTVNDVDQEYIFDTTDGDISCLLQAGTVGRQYRMTNVGTAGNKVVITPDGTEELFGSATESLYDAETLVMTFGTQEGWW